MLKAREYGAFLFFSYGGVKHGIILPVHDGRALDFC